MSEEDITQSIDDMLNGGIGSSSGVNIGQVLPEGLNMPPENITQSIDDMLNGGIGSSSGVNIGQLNGVAEGSYSPLKPVRRRRAKKKPARNANQRGEGSCEVGEQPDSPPQKPKYRRHSKEQLEGLEAFFKECAHPDENERLDLAFDLELEPDQIKFWFQNKRTQVKSQNEKYNKNNLREENEKLKDENKKLKEARSNAICINCICSNPPEDWPFELHQLVISNSLYKEQIKKLREELATFQAQTPLLDLTGVSPHPLEQNTLHHTVIGEAYGPAYPHGPIQRPVNEDNEDIIIGDSAATPTLDPPPPEQFNFNMGEEYGFMNPLGPITIDDMEMMFDISPHLTPRLPEMYNLQHPIPEGMFGPVDPFGPIQGSVYIDDIEMTTSAPLTPHFPELYPISREMFGPVDPLGPIQGPVNVDYTEIITDVSPLLNLQYSITEETNGPVYPFGSIQGSININEREIITGPSQTPHLPEQNNLQHSMMGETFGPVDSLGPILGPVNIGSTEMIAGVGPSQTPQLPELNSIQHSMMEETYGPVDSFGPIQGPVNIDNMEMITDLAVSALQEFLVMARSDYPLWLFEEINSSLVLNKTEYLKKFPKEIGPNSFNFRTEASKDTALVSLSSKDLVEILINEKRWSTVFSGVVASATTLEIISSGGNPTNHNALHLMKAEFQVLSPLVQTRESIFLRYCWNHDDGSWTVTDISLDDNWHPNNTSIRCQRKPSGCLIEDMPDGNSKVTWVEHVEVDDKNSLDLYTPFIHSGLAFGAKRWTTILKRHGQFLTNTMEPTIDDNPMTILPYSDGTRAMLRLAKRMVLSFHNGASSSTAQHRWTLLPDFGFPNIRLMARKIINDPGHPSGTVLSAASSFFLRTPHVRAFGYLRNHQCRHQWDILANGNSVEEVSNILDADEEWNCVSFLRVYSPHENQTKMLLLQESRSDQTGSFVTYTYVDYMAITAVLGGRNSPDLALLPSGFAIFPDGSVSATGSRASLVTISFQVLLSSNPNIEVSKEMVTPLSNLITSTISRIKDSLES